MTTKNQDSKHHQRRQVNQDQPDQQYERFVSLFLSGERTLRAYTRSLLSSRQEVDDVMQNLGLVCWRKFDQFDQKGSLDNFIRWCCVISRFEVLRFRRSRARDRLILSEEVVDLIAVEAEDRLQRSEAEQKVLYNCLQKLDDADRRLLLSVHTRGDSVSRIAAESNKKPRWLYSKLNSLRDLVADCVLAHLAQGET